MFPGVELTTLTLDSDPTWTKINSASSLAGTRNVAAVDAWIAEGRPHLRIKHSPPHTHALNPAENAMGQVVYKMNFFLHQASLSMIWWEDMFSAAITVLNGLPRPASRDLIRRHKPPYELVF